MMKPASNLLATTCAAFLIAAASGLAPLPSAHAAPGAPAAASPAAAAAAPLDATDLEALRAHVNEEVEVRGTPTKAGQNKTGSIAYLDFGGAHKAVSLVFFLKPGEGGKASSQDDVKPFVGKMVTVKGKLADYKGDLQIVIDNMDQIKAAP